jgi:DNA-binding MarR family transcriptional regulator
MSDLIPRVRSFHRTVTQRIGTLNHRYLARDRPLAESQLLFEIGTEGATVRELRARLGLDAGFVSRMLRSLEEEGLVTTVRLADEDGRVRFARLSRAGRAELRR